MDINRFIKLRPELYHLTDKRNIQFILETMELKSTNELTRVVNLSHRDRFLRTKRSGHKEISNEGLRIFIRDQDPLSETIISKCLEIGWTFEKFVFLLNSRVFFWSHPKYLKSHYERYSKKKEDLIILQVRTEDLFEINPSPKFCRINSGAPRCSAYLGGKGVERGSQTFVSAEDYERAPSSVQEVTFENICKLPERIRFSYSAHNEFEPISSLK